MILSDAHQIAFVHIPKCGGTTVRAVLGPLHDQSNVFEFWHDHPKFGRVDLMHLPLSLMRDHFPHALDRVRRYRSFAIVRDPRARFVSSLAERFRHRYSMEMARSTAARLDREIDDVLGRLDSGEAPWKDVAMVHFQPQADYIELDGERVVQTVVPIERIDLLYAGVSAAVGRPIGDDARDGLNRSDARESFKPRSFARDELVWPRRIARSLLPAGLKGKVKDALFPPMKTDAAAAILERTRVVEFIDRHYARDLTIYRDAFAAASDPAELADGAADGRRSAATG